MSGIFQIYVNANVVRSAYVEHMPVVRRPGSYVRHIPCSTSGFMGLFGTSRVPGWEYHMAMPGICPDSKPVVSISARDTVHPVREIHSETPVWPEADYGLPTWVGPCRVSGETGGRTARPPRCPCERWAQLGRRRQGTQVTSPPRHPGCHGDHPSAGGIAAGPTGPRARHAKRESCDSADRARLGPAAGS
jgi:hypothetical protein